jgi:hypothetical protein
VLQSDFRPNATHPPDLTTGLDRAIKHDEHIHI